MSPRSHHMPARSSAIGWLAATLCTYAACDIAPPIQSPVRSPLPGPSTVQAPAAPAPTIAEEPSDQVRRNDECLSTLDTLSRLPPRSEIPIPAAQRHRIFGRAKGWPAVFLRAPLRDTSSLEPSVARLAEGLDDPRRGHSALRNLRNVLGSRKQAYRSTVLREGYLYADLPDTAFRFTWSITLDELFDEQEVWLLRGSQANKLVRTDRGYRYADGADQGKAATLLMFDRVATSLEDLLPALHVDFVPAMHALGFDRVSIERITDEGLFVRLRYGPDGPSVPAAFVPTSEGLAKFVCQVVETGDVERVATLQSTQAARHEALQALRSAITAAVDESLPFDEPKAEEGQQDGSLRPLWERAYLQRDTSYTFNDVRYQVFDSRGRPRPPQVCIDFVLESYERASGTWYTGKDEPRGRRVGRFDFSAISMPNRRGIESVVGFFRNNPGVFAVWDLPENQRVRFQETDRFLDRILRHADEYRSGDVVVIYGMKGDEPHYHSVIVFETDPVSGFPVLVAGNAGKPRIQSWHAAMQSAPLRSIKHRLRPDLTFLRNLVTEGGSGSSATSDTHAMKPSELMHQAQSTD